MPAPWVRVRCERVPLHAGTAGCVVRHRAAGGPHYLLTASHVLAPLADRGDGQDALVGAPVSVSTDGVRWTTVGRLASWSALQRQPLANRLDAAVAQIDADQVERLLALVGGPTGIATPRVGMPVTIRARDGLRATVEALSGAFAPLYWTANGAAAHNIQLRDFLPISPITEGGDSGALAVDDAGRGVGLVTGASSVTGLSYLCPLPRVLDEFFVALPAASTAGQPLLAAPAADRDRTVDVLARTIWGEARGEPLAGQRAVAAVVLNRAMRRPPRWWGATIEAVCRMPAQFSCWNADDPNLPALQAVDERDTEFRNCLAIAAEAAAGALADTVSGATHYHTRSVAPSWSARHVPCVEIANHLFYNDIEP